MLEETPRKMREEAEALLDHVDESQPELQKTLALVRDTAQSIEDTVAGVPEAAQALEAAGEAIGRAKKEIGTLWSTPDGRGESAPPESREPFSLQQVTDSAEAVTETVGELGELVRDLRDFPEPGPLSGGMGAIGTALDSIASEARGFVSHAALLAALLMGLLFVLMLL